MLQALEQTALLKPMHIGPIRIDTPLTLAPMAGQTNHAFRSLCREISGDDCGLVCTELLSSMAMQHKGTRGKTLQRFDWHERESPFAVQLFGSDPTIMAEAARIVADHGADIVDINMGCWVPKIAKGGTGAGAALLRDVCTAVAVVEAVVNAVDVPVTVKVRSGWDAANPTAVEFARAAEGVGAQAIAVHARFAEQGFTGTADWSMITAVKDAVRHIPVIGNGDVTSADDARRMIEQTGCDAIMIGRAALGNPFIFRQIAHALRTGEHLPEPTRQQLAAAALRQARLTVETTRMGERQSIFELRGQLVKYFSEMPDAKRIRYGIITAETLSQLEDLLEPIALN